MSVDFQQRLQHLLWRAGFGPSIQDINSFSNQSVNQVLKALIKNSSASPDYIDVADNSIKGLIMGVNDVAAMQKNNLSGEQKKQLRKQSQKDIKGLNVSWLNLMVSSNAQLREKIALFWHGHFASRNLNIFYQQLLLDVIRRNALGNFGDLLREVSKSAAMINFLNNNQNKKDHPNENFAREVMELFTVGRGNYSESDVKEAARAFTGWGATIQGEFKLRRFQHDNGSKTIFGKTGNFDGEDVLSLLLERRETAYFITSKLFRYFVNDQADPEKVRELSDRFYNTNYNIAALLQDIFSSEWFYDKKNMGSIIKSPVALMVGIRRMLPMNIENEESQLLIQRLLGQLLFFPPNVAGWPGGRNWIDSSSLMFRLRIPQVIYYSNSIQLRPKTDDDQAMGMKENAEEDISMKRFIGMKASINATIDWGNYLGYFEKTQRENLIQRMQDLLLQTASGIDHEILKKHINNNSREDFIKTATIQLMSTPEYQLC